MQHANKDIHTQKYLKQCAIIQKIVWQQCEALVYLPEYRSIFLETISVSGEKNWITWICPKAGVVFYIASVGERSRLNFTYISDRHRKHHAASVSLCIGTVVLWAKRLSQNGKMLSLVCYHNPHHWTSGSLLNCSIRNFEHITSHVFWDCPLNRKQGSMTAVGRSTVWMQMDSNGLYLSNQYMYNVRDC